MTRAQQPVGARTAPRSRHCYRSTPHARFGSSRSHAAVVALSSRCCVDAQYREAGTYPGTVAVQGPTAPALTRDERVIATVK